ncbi:hypothetical protein BGW39_007562 [Mortierella sp. 14UC]|nr:hypothetical protein BGW39_007562 [Mortierella sp. 14UC]
MVAHSKSQRTLSASVLLLLSLLSFTNAQSSPASPTPTPVWGSGTARTPTRFFIQSGSPALTPNNPYPTVNQFFYLDLAVPWTSTAPAWVQLRPGPQMNNFPATASADSKTLFFFRIPGSSPAYQFSVETGNWLPASAAFKSPTGEGIAAVTDPNTDLVYIAGGYSDDAHTLLDVWNWKTGQITNSLLPSPTVAFADRSYYTGVWCKSRQSILYWGGYSGSATRNNVLTELKPPGEWSTLTTTGTGLPLLADHCMAINDEGTKLIVYGGRLETDVFSSQIFILDIPSKTWTTGPLGALPRAYMSCTFAGNQFIAWGGIHTMTQVANGEAVIFDVPSNAWVKQYTPPASYQSLMVAGIPGAVGARPSATPTASGGAPPGPSASNGGDKPSGGSGIGGIVGGIVGGLTVVGAIVGFLFYRRRKAQRQSQDNLYVKANAYPDKSATAAAVSTSTPGHDHGYGGGNGGGAYDEPRPFVASSPETPAAVTPVMSQKSPHMFIPSTSAPGTPGLPANQSYQSPQNAQDQVVGSSAYQLQMQEIENQRQQLELKRQLLILEEQGQQLRPAPPQYQNQLQQQQQYQQQHQQQYQQQQMTQYPMSAGVSAAVSTYAMPTTAATVQSLPVATVSPSMGQYYSTAYPEVGESKASHESYPAVPVVYAPNGISPGGGAPQSLSNSGLTHYPAPPVFDKNDAESAGKGRRNNPHAVI